MEPSGEWCWCVVAVRPKDRNPWVVFAPGHYQEAQLVPAILAQSSMARQEQWRLLIVGKRYWSGSPKGFFSVDRTFYGRMLERWVLLFSSRADAFAAWFERYGWSAAFKKADLSVVESNALQNKAWVWVEVERVP